MRGKSKICTKLLSWKEKAKSRRKVINRQKRRIINLVEKRQLLKSENYQLKQSNIALKKALDLQKRGSITQVKHHSYSAEIIQLCVQLRTQAGCSYRGCIEVLSILVMLLNLELKIPCFTSIRNWELKLGYQQVQRTVNPIEKWALIIDESINIGNHKLLLLIGINLSKYKFVKALSLSDVEVLEIRVSKSWKAEEITEVVNSVKRRGFNFEYSCCDNGNNLRKLLKMIDLVHIEDCGHALGNWLERRYKKDEKFLSFCAKTTAVKRQLIMSKYAEYAPPKHRTKGRFLNLSAISKWAKQLLFIAKEYQQKGIQKDALEKINWIFDYQDFILNLEEEQTLINDVNSLLKNEGLSNKTIVKCQQVISQSQVDKGLKEHLLEYVKRNKDKLPKIEQIICSSDIIESIFGKFKYNTSKNPNGAITEGCLSVANYGKNFEISEIKNAMEQTRIVDIGKWRDENLPVSMQQKKRKLLKNVS